MPSPTSLQSGVTYQSYIQQNPTLLQEPPEIQADVALQYFNSRMEKQPGWTEEPPEIKEQAWQQFKAKYNIPEVRPAHSGGPYQRPSAPPVQSNFFSDLAATAINTGSAGIVDLPHGQGLGANIGSIAGPLIGSLGAAALAPETGGASLAIPAAYAGLVGAGNTAREQYNRTGNIDNPLAVGISGLTNGVFGALGPVAQGVARPIRMAANAAVGGGGNALQDLIQQGAEQHSWLPNVDWERTKNAALMGAGLGGGFAFKGGKRVNAPVKIRGRVRAEGAPYGDFGSSIGVRSKGKLVTRGQKIVQDARKFTQDAQSFRGIDERTTAQTKAKAFKQAFDALEERHGREKNPAIRAKIRQAQAELQKNFQREKQVIRPGKRSIQAGSEDFETVTHYIHQLRKAGRGKEADVTLGQFAPETRAKIYDQVKAREAAEKKAATQAKKDYETEYRKLLAEEKASQKRQRELEAEGRKKQTQKEKQSIKDSIALERAESKLRRKELARLQHDIKARGSEQSPTETKASPPKRTSAAGPRAASRQAIKEEAETAVQTGELVEFDYSAEGGRSRVNEERIASEGTGKDGRNEARQIGGESLDKRQGYRKEVVVETGITKAGDDFMRTIDADGNISTRIIAGKGQKSKVNWLRRTGEQPPDGYGTGGGSRSGESAYSSTLKASVKNMESVIDRLKRGEAVTNKEIIDAAKPLSEKEFSEKTRDLSDDKIDETAKKADC